MSCLGFTDETMFSIYPVGLEFFVLMRMQNSYTSRKSSSGNDIVNTERKKIESNYIDHSNLK